MATLLDDAIDSLPATRDIIIDFLYLDLETCTRCRGTDVSLQTALQEARGILAAAGHRASVRKTRVGSVDQAQALGFLSSPTIRINGQDIALELRESPCDDCSEACGCEEGVDCRVWVWHGQEHTVAPKAMILDAILNAIYSDGTRAEQPVPGPSNVPANLARYFSGKDKAAGRVMSSGCCSPTEQSSCCEPSQKASCCGESIADGCGCR